MIKIMLDQAWFFITNNVNLLITVSAGMFFIGFFFGMSTKYYNMEGRKRGFRKHGFSGQAKKIDKKLEEDYKQYMKETKRREKEYLAEDGSEHHSSKKFKS